MSNKKSTIQKNVTIKNRKASHEYFFDEKFTAGIVLKGTEIKSVRQGKVSLADSFCVFESNELFVLEMHIAEYEMAKSSNHDPKAKRKLLLNKTELNKLRKGTEVKGQTIIPTKIFINEKGLAKLEIALARGKKLHDKRQSIKDQDQKRELKNIKY